VKLAPLFVALEGRDVLLVGGGPVALEKATQLHAAGARVRVVSPAVVEGLRDVAHEINLREYQQGDCDGAWLVYAAAPPAVNRAVKREADAKQRFIVSVDDIEACSAFGAASFERGGVTIALSSNGKAPALVALLRRGLEALIPEEIDRWAEVAQRERVQWKSQGVAIADRRPLLLRALSALYPTTEVST
jgi:siroheme synthase-like protein